jgi:hypothetical protein
MNCPHCGKAIPRKKPELRVWYQDRFGTWMYRVNTRCKLWIERHWTTDPYTGDYSDTEGYWEAQLTEKLQRTFFGCIKPADVDGAKKAALEWLESLSL